jgi:hypothetical protein
MKTSKPLGNDLLHSIFPAEHGFSVYPDNRSIIYCCKIIQSIVPLHSFQSLQIYKTINRMIGVITNQIYAFLDWNLIPLDKSSKMISTLNSQQRKERSCPHFLKKQP